MKKIFLLPFFLLFTVIGFAQLGITAGAQFFQSDDWENHLQQAYGNSNISLFDPAIYTGIDYWFRLKNKRIEFTPEIGFARYQSNIDTDRLPNMIEEDIYKMAYYSFFLNTNFYLLDFGGDCNCPTFNKDGDVIKKGFFLRLSPGVNYTTFNQGFTASAANMGTGRFHQGSKTVFAMRGGLGLDIGLSAFITVTPLVMATYNMPITWNFRDVVLPDDNTVSPVDSQVLQFFAGLRLGFRFDELNKYGYR